MTLQGYQLASSLSGQIQSDAVGRTNNSRPPARHWAPDEDRAFDALENDSADDDRRRLGLGQHSSSFVDGRRPWQMGCSAGGGKDFRYRQTGSRTVMALSVQCHVPVESTCIL
mgnify:CR=1 FL=1